MQTFVSFLLSFFSAGNQIDFEKCFFFFSFSSDFLFQMKNRKQKTRYSKLVILDENVAIDATKLITKYETQEEEEEENSIEYVTGD